MLNYTQSLATGHAAFAGSAEAALKATDSSTGQLLAESVSKRTGGHGSEQCRADTVGRRRGRHELLVAKDYAARSRARGRHSGSHRPAFGKQLALHRFQSGHVESAMNYWANGPDQRVVSLGAGKPSTPIRSPASRRTQRSRRSRAINGAHWPVWDSSGNTSKTDEVT
jgi:hypothetical protein